jgi:hypothetical protein
MSAHATEPDEFALSSSDGQITIRFSDFGIVRPQLNYYDQRELEPRFFGPQDIERSSETRFGGLVTVTLEAVADGDQIDLTLLLPAVRLAGDDDAVNTIAIRTTTRGSIAPQTLTGQLQNYEVIPLNGRARRVGDAAHGNGGAVPRALFRNWAHMHEEDTDEVEIYRPGDFPVPIARGREWLEIEADGGFIRYDIGPGDGPEPHPGRWEMVGEMVIRFSPDEGTSYTRTIDSVEANLLKIRK